MANPDLETVKAVLRDIHAFSRVVTRRPLRAYQVEPARAIVDSVRRGLGLTFLVAMSRQAGKNETQAQLEAYLLYLFAKRGGFIVKASPTFKPQTINSLMRLRSRLDNPWTQEQWEDEEGYMIRFGRARAAFFSAQPNANVVGATADILLEGDEAQDIDPEKWSKSFIPMAASTNATRVLWGTMWTPDTLLGRTKKTLLEAEQRDGIKRVFLAPWWRVAEENPAYGIHVQSEIARLGENHPIVKTQYNLEEIDGEAGLFPPHRQAQMHGDHLRRTRAEPGRLYALLIDVAGEEDDPENPNPVRDSTALTVVEVVRPGKDEVEKLPRYRVVDRRLWTGTRHTDLYATLVDLALSTWKAQRVIIDATGIGAGLASFLTKALGPKLVPFVFTPQSKSDLGWGFLAAVDSGRYKEYAVDDQTDTALFWKQVAAADYELLDGPQRRMRWSVRDPELHDDLLMSAALVARLDQEDLGNYRRGAVVEAREEEW
jgi:hypothetical protein